MLSLIGMIVASTAVQVLLSYYLWRRLVRDTGLRGRARTAATAAIVILQLLIPITTASNRLGATPMARVLAWPAFVWLGLFGLTVVALAFFDLGRLLFRGGAKIARRDPLDPTRRQLLARVGGGAAFAIAVGELGIGVHEALGEHRVVDVPVTIPRLPAALDGFTIVQVTDVHIGMTVTVDFVNELVDAVNKLQPDLIALTGDLVDGPVADIADAVAPVARLSAPHGVFMVTGNHEYYSGVEEWLPRLAELGVRVLRNEHVPIDRDGAGFDLAGVDDHSGADHGNGHGANLPKAIAGRDPSRALVLMAHQPRQVRDCAGTDVDLQLSGHTHGGQVWPWHHIVAFQQGGLLAGRYRFGDTQLYVSRGVGYWGPPVRVGAPAEITRVILRSPR